MTNTTHTTPIDPHSVLFWHPTGPMLRYQEGTLHISDLNPEVTLTWRMSRWELLKLGVRCMWLSIMSPKPERG